MRKNVTVIAKMQENGVVIPLCIIWQDNKKYDIDRVLEIKKQASTKGGGLGLKYICKIKGIEKNLWLDGYVWFVET